MSTRRNPAQRGHGLFGETEPERTPIAAFRANIDGGSRGNPGPSAYGVVVRDPTDQVVARLKKYIGQSTNNVAEYFGLIAALDYAESQNIKALRVESDSELLVKQMSGVYKVKSEELRPLFERAQKMSQRLESFRIQHVFREQNKDADTLVNQALDETAGKIPAAPKDATLRFFGTYKNGVIEPGQPVDLPDGAAVEVMLRLRK